MGGLARPARAGALTIAAAAGVPHWLEGAAATLSVAPDTPTIWLLELDDAARARADAVAIAGEERAFAHRADAGERLVRRRLSRLLLACAAGCAAAEVRVGRDPAAAPVVLHPPGWHLSVAARWPIMAIAVAPHPVGVDVEADGDPLPPDLLTEPERALSADTGRWAAKEAHAKWTGRPRDLDPACVDTAAAGIVTSPLGASRCWRRRYAGQHVALCAE